MNEHLRQIQDFENELDAQLLSREIFRQDPAKVLIDIAGLISSVYSREEYTSAIGELTRGLQIALPILINQTGGDETQEYSLGNLIEDLRFMSHYYMLREYLYYTYNAPNSLEWQFSENAIKIEFRDRSIVRHFAQYANSRMLNLVDFHSKHGDIASRATGILRGQTEFGDGEHIQLAFELAEQEADLRLAHQFDILGGHRSPVKLTGYSYRTFISIYKFILAKSIYHRYYARANDVIPVFRFKKSEFAEEIAANTGCKIAEVRRVLHDISYSKDVGKMPPMYFSIIDHEKLDDYVFIPDLVIESDGPVQLLRAQATRSPSRFLQDVSGPLGDSFVEHVAQLFRHAGFWVKKNVSLSDLDPGLPDIDLLVVSREATLGYFVFTCEVKAALPGLWAKDYLRLLRKDSLPKAFTQIKKIHDALATESGKQLLLQHIFSLDKTPMEEGLVPVRGLIVTSQNTGMFFEELTRDTKVIDHHTLAHVLESCDGDVVYILKALETMRDYFDVEVDAIAVDVGGTTTTYQVVAAPEITPLPKNEWKSTGLDIEIAEAFYADGGSPFDVLDDAPSRQKETGEGAENSPIQQTPPDQPTGADDAQLSSESADDSDSDTPPAS